MLTELETHLNKDVKTEVTIKKKQEIEYVLEGTIKPKVGHKIWELNEETGEIKEAQYKSDTVSFNSNAVMDSEKLIRHSDCVYIPALNIENAKRKYLKNKEQSFYYAKAAPMSLSDITF